MEVDKIMYDLPVKEKMEKKKNPFKKKSPKKINRGYVKGGKSKYAKANTDTNTNISDS